jgi:hypothetical protein
VEENKIATDLHDEISVVLTGLLRDKYPKKDMDILTKYGVAALFARVRIHIASHEKCTITLQEKLFFPLKGGSYDEIPRFGISDFPDYTHTHIRQYRLAVIAEEEADKKLKHKYKLLINSCQYWEDLIELLPEVAELRPSDPNQAIICIDGQIVKEIVLNAQQRREAENKS